MSGRIPNLKVLRKIIEESETKISKSRSSLAFTTKKPETRDHELELVLGTSLRPKTPTPSSYSYLIGEIQQELTEMDKQISLREQEDDLVISSESDDKLTSPFQLSLASGLSNSKLKSSRMRESTRGIETRLNSANIQVKHLEQIVKEKDKKLEENVRKYSEKIDSLKQQVLFLKDKKKKKNDSEVNKKLKEAERKNSEYKKTLYRLQDLNNQLVVKVKELESEKENFDSKRPVFRHKKPKLADLQHMKKILSKENTQVRSDLHEKSLQLDMLRSKYESLHRNSIYFEKTTRELFQVNQLLHENLSSVLSSIN